MKNKSGAKGDGQTLNGFEESRRFGIVVMNVTTTAKRRVCTIFSMFAQTSSTSLLLYIDGIKSKRAGRRILLKTEAKIN